MNQGYVFELKKWAKLSLSKMEGVKRCIKLVMYLDVKV